MDTQQIESPVTVSPSETPSEQGRTRGLRPPWQPGKTGNASGRPRGPFSRRALREARKRGEDGARQLDRVIAALIDKAAGAAKGHDFTKADLRAIEMLRDTLDGPLPRNNDDQAAASGTPQVMVMIRNIAVEPGSPSHEVGAAKQQPLSNTVSSSK